MEPFGGDWAEIPARDQVFGDPMAGRQHRWPRQEPGQSAIARIGEVALEGLRLVCQVAVVGEDREPRRREGHGLVAENGPAVVGHVTRLISG